MTKILQGLAIVMAFAVAIFFHPYARANLDDVGSGKPPRTACDEYLQDVVDFVIMFKHRGYSEATVVSMIKATLPDHFAKNMRWIISEGYAWPRGDEDFRQYVRAKCAKDGWKANDIPDEPQSALPFLIYAASSQKLYCDRQAAFAAQVYRDIQEYGFEDRVLYWLIIAACAFSIWLVLMIL